MKIIQSLAAIAVMTIAASVASHAANTVPEASLKQSLPKFHPLATPIPEPSDWAWVAAAGTIGIVTFRRLRRQSA